MDGVGQTSDQNSQLGAVKFVKPDLVFWNGQSAWVLDVAIEGNLFDLDTWHEFKSHKYLSVPEISAWAWAVFFCSLVRIDLIIQPKNNAIYLFRRNITSK